MDDKKIHGKPRRRCEICNCLKYGVVKIINPYDQDVNGVEHEQAICASCCETLKKDI